LKGVKPLIRINASGQLEIELPDKSAGAEVQTLVDKLDTTDFSLKPAGRKVEGEKLLLTYVVEQREKNIDMSKLIAAINRRINPGGVLELTVRQYGARQIEVIIPEVDPRQIASWLIRPRISTSSHWPGKPRGGTFSKGARSWLAGLSSAGRRLLARATKPA
jgi:preprotein translocase subunit SecD